MKNKKLRAFLSGVLAVCFMLGAIVPASASGFLGGDLVKWVEDNWGNILGDLINGKSDDANDTSANDLTTTAATDSEDSKIQWKILHLDCGRKYFSKDWIIALMYEAKAAGYNQIQLAFGNKGLRFLLDEMDVTVNGEYYPSDSVKEKIQEGNKAYYDAGEKNELTQSEMDEIIDKAKEIGIEIVPLFNTPYHMEAVITAMGLLGISNAYYGDNKACLNLSNSTATAFVKALMQKYIDYFKNKCNYFNFGADEYTGGWNSTFYTYANEIVTKITDAEMKARIFNDSFRTNGNSGDNYVKNAQVCYWSSNSGYASTKTVYSYSKEIINTNQDFYYVVNKDTQQSTWGPDSYYAFSGAYNESTWTSYAEKFSNNTYKNFAGYNNGAESINPIGAMFCVWCDNPSHKDETQIAKEIRSILRIIGQRMNDETVSDYSYNLVGGFNADGTINTGKTDPDPIDPVDPTDPTDPTEPKKIEITLEVGQTSDEYEHDGAPDSLEISSTKPEVAEVNKNGFGGGTGGFSQATSIDTTKQYVIENKGYYLNYDGNDITSGDQDRTTATKWTFTESGDGYTVSTTYNGKIYYLCYDRSSTPYLSVKTSSSIWYFNSTYGIYATYITQEEYWDRNDYQYKYRDVTNYASLYYYYYSKKNNVTQYWNINDSTSQSTTYSNTLYTYTPAEPSKTKISFTGVTPGTTKVTVGTGDNAVTYVVTVTKKTAAKLYVDFWVTDMPVNPDNVEHITEPSSPSTGKDVTRAYIGIERNAAIDPDGVRLLDLIGSTTGVVYNTGKDAVIWKARYLPADCRQTTDGWTNKSGEGTDKITSGKGGFDFEYIRYDDTNGWQYKDEKGNWKPFPSDPTQDTSGAQIAIYYRQPTDVTDEVKTEVIDWPDGVYKDDKKTELLTFYGVAVDFTVKYEAGDKRYPDKFGRDLKTYWYNCDGKSDNLAEKNGYSLDSTKSENSEIESTWGGEGSSKWYRVINNIHADETGNYEVYMITVTPSDMKFYSSASNGSITGNAYACPETITYYNSSDKNGDNTYEKIIWAIDEETANNSSLTKMPETEIHYGGEPEVNRLVIRQGTGMLVTYYVRAKTSASNLKVHYIDEDSGRTFYEYEIAPFYYEDSNTFETFKSTFDKDTNDTTYGLTDNDVVNDKGNTVYVTSKLEDMNAIEAQYRRVQYEFTKVEKSEDLTEVFLYYKLSNKYYYVVDFGIPLKIQPKDVVKNISTAADIEVFVMNGTNEVSSVTLDFGKAVVSGTDIIYTLTDMDFSSSKTKVDSFTVRYYGTNTATDGKGYVEYLIYIYPANSIYYEAETGVKNDGTTTKVGDFITFEGDWTRINNDGEADNTENSDVYQALEALGNALYPFGYDPSYKTWSKFSLGSAMKSTVKKDTKDAPSATFTFTGTGFDVISLTSKTTGAVIVEITDENNKRVKNYIVNSYYGYTYTAEEGWTPVKKTEDEENNPLENALYQVPVIKVTNLDYGKYTVKIYTKYSSFFDILGLGWYSFYLDAIRIYDPAGDQFKGMEINDNNSAEFADEIAYYTKYFEVRDLLDGNNSVFVDGKEVINTNDPDYASVSPNHEVYLAGGEGTSDAEGTSTTGGQSIAFKLKVKTEMLSKIKSVEIAAKLVQGDIVLMTSSVPFVTSDNLKDVTKTDVKIDTATDMYYKFDMTNAWNDEGDYSTAIFVISNSSDSKDNILSLTNIKITSTEIIGDDAETTLSFIADDETVEAALNYTYVPEPEIPEEPEILPFEPEYISASWTTVGRYLRTCTLSVVTSRDVDKLTLDGSELTARTAFRRVNGKYQSVYIWTYVKMNAPKGDYKLVAYNEDGVASEPVVVTLDK